MKAIKKVCSLISDIITAVLMFAVMVFIVMSLMGIRPYVILSGSMEPVIQTGSICFVDSRVSYKSIREGDIIAFVNPLNKLTTHRVVSVSDEGIETKGDANETSDGITTNEENYKGKSFFSVPYVGYAVEFFQTMQGRIWGVTLIVMLIILAVFGKSEEESSNKEKYIRSLEKTGYGKEGTSRSRIISMEQKNDGHSAGTRFPEMTEENQSTVTKKASGDRKKEKKSSRRKKEEKSAPGNRASSRLNHVS